MCELEEGWRGCLADCFEEEICWNDGARCCDVETVLRRSHEHPSRTHFSSRELGSDFREDGETRWDEKREELRGKVEEARCCERDGEVPCRDAVSPEDDEDRQGL